ncbi:MAG: glycoside hydrolase family 18 protein [bacterium]|nr:glycoside hydrolase family 18 protein [bacterium]
MLNLPIYYQKQPIEEESVFTKIKRRISSLGFVILFLSSILIFSFGYNMINSYFSSQVLSPLQNEKSEHEVFGFAPYWTFNKLDNVDFEVLTTLAYFGIEVDSNGELDTEGRGYEVFKSDKATEIFKKAHSHGSRVVLTLTQMNNDNINALLDNPQGQKEMTEKAVSMVKSRGIDGINIDFEYVGNPGQEYRDKFTRLVDNVTKRMHEEIPSSKVTVSVYASAVKEPKIYDISALSNSSDGIFMMAYDFATAGSDNAIPTSPLYGHKEGKYWYDVSTAVDDFLTVMPAEKLILGLPWYGYNYPVQTPEVKAQKDNGYYTYYWWRGYRYSRFASRENALAQTYASANNDNPTELEGWDDFGKVGWKAYKDAAGLWRMIFLDDTKSLDIKYEFAKSKNLGGVGMWALGFDDGKQELWTLLKHKFGAKLADNAIINRKIN